MAGTIAVVELLVLVVVGGALIAKPSADPQAAAVAKHAAPTEPARALTTKVKHPAAELSRPKVVVLVLNGNGRTGAAAGTASRVSRRGYRVGGVANAPRSDFTRTLVMYRKGFEGEGRRLASDLGIRIVGPLDGLRAGQLNGAHAVVVVGS